MKSRATRSTSRGPSRRVVSFTAAIIITIVGFLISQPFFWIVIVSGTNYHYITFSAFMMLIGFIVGSPMFLFGLLNVFLGDRPVSQSSTTDLDIARIRYTVETDHQNRR